MTQEVFEDWDATSSNNITVTGDGAAINIAEGMAPGLVNDAMRAIMSAGKQSWGGMQSGTSTPTSLLARRFWLDTTTATAPIMTWYDGTDDIPFATIDETANTITIDSGVVVPKLVRGTAVAATSGTAIDFTGIPAGVDQITILFSGVAMTGADTADLMIQIGDSGGFETTGYSAEFEGGTTSGITGTSFMQIFNMTDAALHNGMVILSRIDGNTWVSAGNIFEHAAGAGNSKRSAGTKTLSGELTQVRISSGGAIDTFSAGTINIFYQ
jgi:hypothetical protein